MSYGKLLYREMLSKNINTMQLAEKLGKSHTYISRIINGKVKPPTEKVNNEIAKILDIDVRILNIEGYYDKAPKEIKDFLKSVVLATTNSAIAMYKANTESFKNLEIGINEEMLEEALKKEPVSAIIMDFIDNSDLYFEKSEEIGKLFQMNEYDKETGNITGTVVFENPFTSIITDNGMAPEIPINSRVKTEMQEKYSNGDIVCLNGKDGIIIREYVECNNYVFLIARNKEFEPKQIAKEDIKKIIMGKVIEYIIKM